ncbi:uncharacterized protein LOC107365424 isoform X3 [Tetranychus urticae]|uniref:uncharacterized protein LOC107365424 isoform X3 n=1 Tax=Tetranychus urticae TaxID=32264 RepID=UPI000D64DE5F|nr:uncharacterized protein LOC107365424 isoform X3 [Tetranychus urticae]
MEQHNDNSNKTTFKVKFLGEYHDVVIDWNDDKYEYKHQQIFEQLESLTGIPIKYKTSFMLRETRPHLHKDYPNAEIWFRYGEQVPQRQLYFFNNRQLYCDFVKDNIHDVCIQDGERFQLRFHVRYDSMSLKRIGIDYDLVPETWVEEGVCTDAFCQHTQTKSYFKRIKDLVTNDGLNSQISHRIQPLQENMRQNADIHWFMEMEKIYREFNVQQCLRFYCHLINWHARIYDEDGVVIINIEQYLRMRG